MDKVVQIIEPLNQPFHAYPLANDCEQRTDAFGIERVRVRLIQCFVVRLFRVGDSTMEQFPTLPGGFVFKEDDWRFSFLVLV